MSLNNLNYPFDYIVLVIILIIVIFCFWKGFIQSILGLLTWIGSILITIYSYESLSSYITKQLLNINFFQKIEYLTNIGSIFISIPIIFLLSLFILKRIRGYFISDLDKQVMGVIVDKIFGIMFGLVFSFIIISSFLIILKRTDLNALNGWLINNSKIILNIENFNNKYIYLEEAIEKVNDL